MEQIFPVQIEKAKQFNQTKKKSSQISFLQNKIKSQEKNITSLQKYISQLETKLKISNNNNSSINYEFESNSQEYINKLKQEKEDILSQLKQEIILNDEQRNYIEILKQALESNIAKHGLTEKINFLKKKYYSENGIGGNAQIILDISKLKENNEFLIKEKEKNFQKINELNTQKEQLEKNLNSFNKLNKEYNLLIENNNELNNELNNLKKLFNEKEKDIIDLKEKYIQSTKQNEFLSNENNNLKSLRKDNIDLAKSVSDLCLK